MNGITLASVSINLSIAANPQYISSSQINLKIQVIVLLACCACRNMSSADIFHCSYREILLQFETVKFVNSFHACFHMILIVHVLTCEKVIFKSQTVGSFGFLQIYI